jgi:hypothetical protein
LCVPCRIWNFVWRTVCHKCGAPRGVSDDDWMEWETTDADPSEVSSGPEAPTIARRLFFPTRFSIESSHNLAEVLILNNNFFFFFTDTYWLCVLCNTWNFVRRAVCFNCGACRNASDEDCMDWQTSTSFPSSDPTPQQETAEVSSGPETQTILRSVLFPTRYTVESSRILTDVLETVGLGEYTGKQNYFIFKFKISYYESP